MPGFFLITSILIKKEKKLSHQNMDLDLMADAKIDNKSAFLLK